MIGAGCPVLPLELYCQYLGRSRRQSAENLKASQQLRSLPPGGLKCPSTSLVGICSLAVQIMCVIVLNDPGGLESSSL
jgi:hypothetical protein